MCRVVWWCGAGDADRSYLRQDAFFRGEKKGNGCS